MFDFLKKMPYEDYRQGAFKGFLLECPDEVRNHILLCVKCQESLNPIFQVMYGAFMDANIFDLTDKINEDIIKHIKENKKLNRNV